MAWAPCFTQSHGAAAFAGFALFLYLEQKQGQTLLIPKGLWKKYVIFTSGFLLSVLLITVPFVLKAGFQRFFYCTFVFLARYYGATQLGNDWRSYMIGLGARLHKMPWHLAGFLLVHALLPLIYLLALLRYFRGQLPGPPQHRDRLLLIALVGFFLFLSVASAPAWNRLYFVCFPALILLTCFLVLDGKRGQIVLDVLLGATVVLAVATPLGVQTHKWVYLDLPGGRTAFDDTGADRYSWVATQTRSSEYFFGGFYPDFYFLLNLKNPGTVPFMTPDDFTRPSDVTDAIQGIERHHVRLLLWAARLDLPPNVSTDHLGPLRAYIRSHYCVLRSFPGYQAWIRVESRDPSSHPILACPKGP